MRKYIYIFLVLLFACGKPDNTNIGPGLSVKLNVNDAFIEQVTEDDHNEYINFLESNSIDASIPLSKIVRNNEYIIYFGILTDSQEFNIDEEIYDRKELENNVIKYTNNQGKAVFYKYHSDVYNLKYIISIDLSAKSSYDVTQIEKRLIYE